MIMNNAPTPDVDGSKEPLLPYYVYVLLNPLRSNKAFYVGKGTGQRAGTHERNIDRLLEEEERKRNQQLEQEEERQDEDSVHRILDEILSNKQREILEIKNANSSPLQVIVGRYETKEEAYAVEAALIHFMFGYENLTNVASGHGYKFLRTKNEYEKIVATAKEQKDIPLRKGIDIERGMRDHIYKDEKFRGLEQARAFDQLAELQRTLTAHKFNWRDFTEPSDKYFHPGISNGYLAVIVRISSIDFRIQFTKKKSFSIQFIYTPTCPKTLEEAKSLALVRFPQIQRERLNVTLSEPKAGNIYSWIHREDRVKFESIDALIVELEKFRSVIEQN